MERVDAFEYAIRKDVRNNPIVREVDEQRQRELWQSIGIGCLLVLVLLFSAWQHFELLRHGYRVDEMQRQRAMEEEIKRHLRLELEALRAPQRIERLATEQLGMVAPGMNEAIVLERITVPDRASSSLVAEHRAVPPAAGMGKARDLAQAFQRVR
jgi:cell division protein FtsL